MFYIFEGFAKKGILAGYTTMRWTRKFQDVGEFELTLPYSLKRMQLLTPGRIIYKRDTDEAAFIQDRYTKIDEKNKENLIVKGNMISEILTRRIVTYIGTVSPAVAIENLVRQNMIEASNQNRNITDLVLDNSGIVMDVEQIQAENQELKQTATDICKEKNLGYRVKFDHKEKKFRFQLYQGRISRAKFLKQFGNILEQEYYEATSSFKNTVIVDDNGKTVIVNNQNSGLDRREAYTMFNSSEGGSSQTQGEMFLKNYTLMQSMDTVIDPLAKQFKYLVDWDIGDIVACRNSKWGIAINKNVLEIEEFYDTDGLHLSVVFGDHIPTLKERIAQNGR